MMSLYSTEYDDCNSELYDCDDTGRPQKAALIYLTLLLWAQIQVPEWIADFSYNFIDQDDENYNQCTDEEMDEQEEWLDEDRETNEQLLYDDGGNWIGCGLEQELDNQKNNGISFMILLNGLPFLFMGLGGIGRSFSTSKK